MTDKFGPSILQFQEQVRSFLRAQGFLHVYFARPPLAKKQTEAFQKWLARGFNGEMAYLKRRAPQRLNPEQLIPELQSVMVLAYPYDVGELPEKNPSFANISRYAWGQDYHMVLAAKMDLFYHWLKQQCPEAKFFHSIDIEPVLEKAWAQQAGLGWIGKHTNLIHSKSGSYFFLATMLSNLEFVPDSEAVDHCGSCTQCIDICPTQAIIAPYILDARLCISYLTIELKGAIPRKLRPLIGNHVFGCDDCQEVCPWNRFSQRQQDSYFLPREFLQRPPLDRLLGIQKDEFKFLFENSAILRAKWKGFMRNVLVAVGNSGDQSLASKVQEKLTEPEPLVRGHAVWAYSRLLGSESNGLLQQMKTHETDVFVLEEIHAALS